MTKLEELDVFIQAFFLITLSAYLLLIDFMDYLEIVHSLL